MLMAVCAPTLSTLLAAACGDNDVAHCHHQQPKAHHVLQKCGYCLVQADLPAVPPPASLALALMLPSRAAPRLPAAAPLPLRERLAPPSRAPPSA